MRSDHVNGSLKSPSETRMRKSFFNGPAGIRTPDLPVSMDHPVVLIDPILLLFLKSFEGDLV